MTKNGLTGWWTTEREEEAKRVFHANPNMSFGQIADAIGCPSHSSMCGKAKRLGLTRGRPHASYKPRIKKPGRLNFVFGGGESKPPARLPDEPTLPTSFRSLNMLDLQPNDCRWPQGDGPFVFCGCPKAAYERPYCSYHERIARPQGSALAKPARAA